jgi:hypothetical protein
MENIYFILIALLGVTTYVSAVYQMLYGIYSPSFFSRGVWLLLGINSFIGVLFGDGTKASIILAATLLFGNLAVFLVSYKKGSREFGVVEKISLILLVIAFLVWVIFKAPFLTLILSLAAHFIGGIPTIWRTIVRPENEQAWHWYFFFTGCIISIIASPDKHISAILFPVYFAFFDGIIILLANRKRFF